MIGNFNGFSFYCIIGRLLFISENVGYQGLDMDLVKQIGVKITS